MPWFWLMVASAGMMLGADEGPGGLGWSGDGQWLAYTQTNQPATAPPEGWLFKDSAPPPTPAEPRPTTYQIWATRPATGESSLLAESSEPLSSPCWRPDDAAIAYGRWVGGAAPAWEVVVQDDPKRRRVVYRERIDGPIPDAQAVHEIAPAFSFDGRLLVIGRPGGAGLLVIKVEEGTLAQRIDGGRKPQWSPTDWRLAFLREGPVAGLFVVDLRQGPPRRLADLAGSPRADSLPPPIWARDGQTVQFVRLARDGGDENSAAKLELVRVNSETGFPDLTYDLVHDPVSDRRTAVTAFFSADLDGGDLYYSAITPPPGARFATCSMTWCFQKANEVRKRLNPFDELMPLGALAARPADRAVGLRVRTRGTWSPPGICDPETERLTLIAPDDASRNDWRARIAATIEQILIPFPDPSLPGSRAVERASLLPAPGETEPGDLVSLRLRRLGRLGQSLGPMANDEAALAFAYFAENHDDALRVLQSLDEQATTTDRRQRLLAVRAQVMIAQRDFEGARAILDYLRSRQRPEFRVEDSLTTTEIVPVLSPRSLWPEFLSYKAQILKAVPPLDDAPQRVRARRDELDLMDNRGAAAQPLAAPVLHLMAEPHLAP